VSIILLQKDSFLTLRNLHKSFGEVKAVNDISVQIHQGELVSFIGPSGCGKTTLLRIIGGFHRQDSGKVIVDHENIDDLPPERRPTGMVFQDYALFPHMTVYQNIEYGLNIQKINKGEKIERIKKVLYQTQLEKYIDRKPSELSGGQQQRVAIARCLVLQPKVLLLDEPLSNLDANLRSMMREEIRQLKEDLNLTVIFVTHDQEEALSISDRVVVLNNGQIQQVGKPHIIYNYPKNEFVAKFVGSTNIIEGYVDKKNNVYYFNNGKIKFPIEKPIGKKNFDQITTVIRPERLKIDLGSPVKGIVDKVVYNGNFIRYFIQVNGIKIIVDEMNKEDMILFTGGESIGITFPKKLHYI